MKAISQIAWLSWIRDTDNPKVAAILGLGKVPNPRLAKKEKEKKRKSLKVQCHLFAVSF